MKRVLILLIALLSACGESSPKDTGAAAEALSRNPVLYTFTAVNNQVTIPQARNSDSACYLTWMQGGGGYAGQPTWPNGAPKSSAQWYFERNYNPNVVSAQHLVGVGTKITQAKCSPFSNFDNAFFPGQPNNPAGPIILQTINLQEWQGQGPHNVDVPLDAGGGSFQTGTSFCYLKNVGGMTRGDTFAYVYASGGIWRLRYYGYPTANVQANCVDLRRPYFSTSNGVVTAYAGSPANLNTYWGEGICYLMGAWGDLNNGSIWIDENGPFGTYRLNVGPAGGGGVWGGTAMCVSYFWDQP